jgi:Cu/Ag efflux protein CusF
MTRRTVLLITVWTLGMAGCGSKSEKRYPMEGDVVALDPSSKTATIKAGKIGDWMEAMTMEYPVKPDAEFAKLKTGAHIKATVVVEGELYHVTGIEVTATPAGK